MSITVARPRELGPTETLLSALREPTLPVDVLGLARRLGIQVTIDDSGVASSGVLVRASGALSIRTAIDGGRKGPDGLSARQRFTVAHEVAHVLLARWGHAIRLRRGNEERGCEELAAEILLPTSVVRHHLDSGDGAADIIEALLSLSQRAAVSVHAAAIAVARLSPDYEVSCVLPSGARKWTARSTGGDEVLGLDRLREKMVKLGRNTTSEAVRVLDDGSRLVVS